MWRRLIKRGFAAGGYSLIRTDTLPPEIPPDLGPTQVEIFQDVRAYTMTSVERIAALVDAVKYIASAGIDGAIVECGVWRGGSMMAIARTLLATGGSERELFLFDTFEGMPAPRPDDVDFLGRSGSALLQESKVLTHEEQLNSLLLAYAPLDHVQSNMLRTGYPKERIHFVKGRVEDTIPAEAPDTISLLRLDTDWYESTRHELIHLFPRLSRGGVVIIDDYGHWRGSRRAVDEYFEQHGPTLLLHRIDYTARAAMKP